MCVCAPPLRPCVRVCARRSACVCSGARTTCRFHQYRDEPGESRRVTRSARSRRWRGTAALRRPRRPAPGTSMLLPPPSAALRHAPSLLPTMLHPSFHNALFTSCSASTRPTHPPLPCFTSLLSTIPHSISSHTPYHAHLAASTRPTHMLATLQPVPPPYYTVH